MALINNGNASNVLDNISTTFNIGINQQPDGIPILNTNLIQKTLQIDNIIV